MTTTTSTTEAAVAASSGDDRVEPAVLVYHESARSIVFRDDLRRRRAAVRRGADDALGASERTGRFVSAPAVRPLAPLARGPGDAFAPLAEPPRDDESEEEDLSEREREVLRLFRDERALVKTIRNSDWTAFLRRFEPSPNNDGNDGGGEKTVASFRTSTSCLPSQGRKMRCFGSLNEFTTGVVFALPPFDDDDDVSAEMERTRTWCWPAGYSAKTEFNINDNGDLINGRQEASVTFSELRRLNHTYLHDVDHELALGRVVKGGLRTVPYNEVYVRVGGDGAPPSLGRGLGRPVALFARSADYGSLVALLRARARAAARGLVDAAAPLLLVEPAGGVRVVTSAMRTRLLRDVASNVNPFQNPTVAHKTTRWDSGRNDDGDGDDGEAEQRPDPEALRQKSEELLDLDADDVRRRLTAEECARLAGGFGATDDSVAAVLLSACENDSNDDDDDENDGTGRLVDVVNEGLSSAVRAGDHHTSRQLLILYTLVASRRRGAATRRPRRVSDADVGYESESSDKSAKSADSSPVPTSSTPVPPPSSSVPAVIAEPKPSAASTRLAPPPPPPLDTDRLRSATNSDGLLSVLGAAEVLKSLQDGSAKRRVLESISAVEEWVSNGERSFTFRLASWHDQRVAQGDLRIATDNDSSLVAFVSNKAVSNRRRFAESLRDAVSRSDFDDLACLRAVHDILGGMHSPCLRLELLQYILGLDNRYSVAHVARSVELAATCLGLACADADADADDDDGTVDRNDDGAYGGTAADR